MGRRRFICPRARKFSVSTARRYPLYRRAYRSCCFTNAGTRSLPRRPRGFGPTRQRRCFGKARVTRVPHYYGIIGSNKGPRVRHADRRPWLLFETYSDWRVMPECAPRQSTIPNFMSSARRRKRSSPHGFGKLALSNFVHRRGHYLEDALESFKVRGGALRLAIGAVEVDGVRLIGSTQGRSSCV